MPSAGYVRRKTIELTIGSKPQGRWTIVGVEGEVDLSNASRLRKHIVEQVEGGNHHLAVNLEAVDFMDSSGLAVLISGLRRTKEHEGALVLVSPTASVKRVLSITGLDKVFPIYESLEEATQS